MNDHLVKSLSCRHAVKLRLLLLLLLKIQFSSAVAVPRTLSDKRSGRTVQECDSPRGQWRGEEEETAVCRRLVALHFTIRPSRRGGGRHLFAFQCAILFFFLVVSPGTAVARHYTQVEDGPYSNISF